MTSNSTRLYRVKLFTNPK